MYRDLYSVSILLQRACGPDEEHHGSRQAIMDLDLATLMGGPLFRKEVRPHPVVGPCCSKWGRRKAAAGGWPG